MNPMSLSQDFVNGFAVAAVLFSFVVCVYAAVKLAILELKFNHGTLQSVNHLYEEILKEISIHDTSL